MNNTMKSKKSTGGGNLTTVRTPKKISKKLLATLLTVVMLMGMSTGVMAKEKYIVQFQADEITNMQLLYNESVIKDIRSLMLNIVSCPSEFGAINANLSTYSICSPIFPNAIDEVAQKKQYCVYPILDANGNIVLTATTGIVLGGTVETQISIDYVAKINSVATVGDMIAIVDSYNSTIVVSESSIEEFDYRTLFNDYKFKKIEAISIIDLSDGITPFSDSSRYLNIPNVSQSGVDMLCWAAGVSSIGEYKTKIYKSIFDIATAMSIPYNKGATSEETAQALGIVFGLTSSVSYSPLYFSTIKTFIDQNKPIISEMRNNEYLLGHGVTVCGYAGSTINSTITFMDSMFGTKRTSTIDNNKPFSLWIDTADGSALFSSTAFIYIN